MKQSARLFMGLLVPALMLAFATATPAMKHEMDKAKDAKAAPAAKAVKGQATLTVLKETDKVRVYEVSFKPGDETASIARPFRVIRALKGGTIQRTYPDGKTEKVVYKDGEVKLVGPDPVFKGKNVGKTTILLYVVQPK